MLDKIDLGAPIGAKTIPICNLPVHHPLMGDTFIVWSGQSHRKLFKTMDYGLPEYGCVFFMQ